MTITLAILYYLFLAVVVFFIVYSLFNIYHLLRFGFLSPVNIGVIVVYVVVAVILLLLAFEQLTTVNWNIVSLDTSNLLPIK